ncbi:hypothetical protein SAMN05892883_0757 [Jatrophihabitans sp. GAS493]|nr:hypothetical protein SAMN05892883_0757 [Jatrophihabitans sp. GAS493]
MIRSIVLALTVCGVGVILTGVMVAIAGPMLLGIVVGALGFACVAFGQAVLAFSRHSGSRDPGRLFSSHDLCNGLSGPGG